jgi:hypothetical protein
MDSGDVQLELERQLRAAPPLDNAHGITLENVRAHIIAPPVLVRFENAGIPSGPPEVEVWIVLDECPESEDGYLVVYHPDSRMYGLALKKGFQGRGVFLGCYGSLVETLNAM